MKKYTIALIWLTTGCLIAMVLFSCSANYHFGKFLKKGGQVGTKIELVETTDTIRINGKDSVILIKVPVTCPDVKIPPTRQEIRYKYKIQRDSIQTVRYVTKWKTKEVVKIAKSENKPKWWLLLVGLILGLLTIVIFKR
jgi:hypothetical protein